MVEMVVKLWRLMGFLVEKEEEEDGEVVVVVVGMEEEMEERMVVEKFVEKEEWVERMADQRKGKRLFLGAGRLLEEERGKKNERERRKVGVLYIREKLLLQVCHCLQNK